MLALIFPEGLSYAVLEDKKTTQPFLKYIRLTQTINQ